MDRFASILIVDDHLLNCSHERVRPDIVGLGSRVTPLFLVSLPESRSS
jgi:hypothetical protein